MATPATPALLRATKHATVTVKDQPASVIMDQLDRFMEEEMRENLTNAISMKAYTGIISVKAKIPNCEYCGKQFPKKGNLEKHMLSVHDSPKEDSLKQKVRCERCGMQFPKKGNLNVINARFP